MSALDDAIAAHMAHPAGGMGDPLTDSWAEQQACTQPAPLAAGPALREGWENEPVRVPHHWPLYLLAFLIGLLGFGLGGCTHLPQAHQVQQREPAAIVFASCPPLPERRVPGDSIAPLLRQAEFERWHAMFEQLYNTCRNAALAMPTPRDPPGFKGWNP